MYIYNISSEIVMDIGEGVRCTFAPLRYSQRQTIVNAITEENRDVLQSESSSYLAIKYTLKKIEGTENSFKIELRNGEVTKECLDLLYANRVVLKIQQCALRLVNGISDNLEIPNVQILDIKDGREKKK